MEKNKINQFVQKYTLSGLVESVKWEIVDNTLRTSFVSDDKSVLGNVSFSNFNFQNSVFGIYDTSILTKMLNVLDNDIQFDVLENDNKPVSLQFKDKSTSVNYILADISVIPNVPNLKQFPKFDAKITLDQNFINTFIKAKNALNDENNFTFIFKNNKAQTILGYSNINTNRIYIDVNCECEVDIKPISFSATYLKEIFNANRDATEATLKISAEGLAHANFKVNNFESNYYLVQLQS